MEEAPLISDWARLTTTPNVVVVPFFISDGLHSYQDIPVLLGIEPGPTAAAGQRAIFRRNPHQLHGREPLLCQRHWDRAASCRNHRGAGEQLSTRRPLISARLRKLLVSSRI